MSIGWVLGKWACPLVELIHAGGISSTADELLASIFVNCTAVTTVAKYDHSLRVGGQVAHGLEEGESGVSGSGCRSNGSWSGVSGSGGSWSGRQVRWLMVGEGRSGGSWWGREAGQVAHGLPPPPMYKIIRTHTRVKTLPVLRTWSVKIVSADPLVGYRSLHAGTSSRNNDVHPEEYESCRHR